MSAHTPGPWTWWVSNSWKRLKRSDYGITQNVMEPYVCSDGHPDCSISDADMRLIAAAPDMLKALRMVEQIMTAETWRAVHAAIAKAEPLPVRQSIDEE